MSAPAPEPHSGRAQVASASRWEILELDAWTGWWERPGASRPGAGVRAPQARLARCAEAQPPTAAHRLTRRPSLSTSTRSAREEPPPPGVAGVRWGSVLPRETLQRMETRRDESRRVPRTVGARVSNFRGRGGGAEGRTYYSTGRRALGSLLPLLPLLRPSWRWQPGLPAHMPGPRSDRARAGRGLGGARPPPLAGDSLGTRGRPGARPAPGRRLPRRARFRPGGALREPGRSPPSALCPLPSAAAVSLPSAVLPRIRPDAAPARRSALRDPARSRAGPPRRTAAPGLRPGPPLRGGCQDPHSHTSVPSRDWEPGARGCEATPQPQRRKREGDREPAAGGGGGRVGRWRRREGQRVPSSSLQPGPSCHQQLETSGGKGRAKAPERRGWVGAERIEERRGFCHSHCSGMRVAT